MKTGIFIGRFQPFHNAHLAIIKDALTKVDKLIIGIGSAQYSNTRDNPFSVEERKHMIESALKYEKIDSGKYEIIPIKDINKYSGWVDHVEKLAPDFELVFTGSPITKMLFKRKYEIVDVKRVVGISASTIRAKIVKCEGWEQMVPDKVVNYIKSINGDRRIRELSK